MIGNERNCGHPMVGERNLGALVAGDDKNQCHFPNSHFPINNDSPLTTVPHPPEWWYLAINLELAIY